MKSFVLRADVRAQHAFEVRSEGVFRRITAIEQRDEFSAEVFFADEDVTAEHDFELIIAETGEQRLPTVLSYAPRGRDELGYYALWLPPLTELAESDPIPRSITFVIDVSSSMRSTRLVPVKTALAGAIEELNADDFFSVIVFSNDATAFTADPVQATGENKEAAMDFVRQQMAQGATNFEAALRQALRQSFPEGRINHIVFLTDGHPSVGEQNLPSLSQMVEELTGDEIRIFTIGVGNNVNRSFLRALAEDHRGSSSYVSVEEDIETALRALFEEFTRPVFLPSELVFEGIDVYDVYTGGFDLLATGQELFQVGRYPEGGQFVLKLEDRVLDVPRAGLFAAEEVHGIKENAYYLICSNSARLIVRCPRRSAMRRQKVSLLLSSSCSLSIPSTPTIRATGLPFCVTTTRSC